MPLSTSNSKQLTVLERKAFQCACVVFLLLLILAGFCIELGTRKCIYRMSKDLGRINGEAAAVGQLRKSTLSKREILLVGNSLLLWGVDVSALNRDLEPQSVASRFAIQQTTYYDWYFGLRHILAEGAQPDMIVLCLEPRHIIQNGLKQEFFAHYLMQKKDVWRIKQLLGLGLTDLSDLLLANISAFFALRKEIRKNLLVKFLPDFPTLTDKFIRTTHPPINLDELKVKGKARLESMRKTADSFDVKFAVLMMPPVSIAQASTLRDISDESGVPILVPMDDKHLGNEDFQSDQYHLNGQGREKFTNEFGRLLTTLLGHESILNP
jgi:hypothetical protein